MPVCPLSYPERFYAAVSAANSVDTQHDDDTRLVLYALYQQATLGPNTGARPWAWNTLESAQHEAWKHLGGMSRVEAMRLYVRTLEQAQPQWWDMLTRNGDADAQRRAVADAQAAASSVSSAMTSVNSGSDAPTGARHGGSAQGSGIAPGAAKLTAGPAWCELPSRSGTTMPLKPRYEHAACVVDDSVMYVFGGYRNGRALRDVLALDLETLQWSGPLSIMGGSDGSSPTPLPPVGGHVAVHVGDGRVLLFGGHIHVKAAAAVDASNASEPGAASPARMQRGGRMTVHSVDTRAGTWMPVVVPAGAADDAPAARGGHSACYHAARRCVFVFGGEGPGRVVYGDVSVFHVDSNRWERLKSSSNSGMPQARSAHSAVIHANRMYVYGGTLANGTCAGGLHVLNLETQIWSEVALKPSPEMTRTSDGADTQPAPRAGCAGALVFPEAGSATPWWVIAGGGDGRKPATDTLALGPLGPDADAATITWHQIAMVPQRSPLAAEGLSLVSYDNNRILLAACGYNGSYHNSVHALRPALPRARTKDDGPAPTKPVLPQPAATPLTPRTPKPTVPPEPVPVQRISQPSPRPSGAPIGSPSPRGSAVDVAVPASELEQRLASVTAELVVVQRQLSASVSRVAQLESDLALARSRLEAEQARALRAEAEVAEMRREVEDAQDSERQLTVEVRRAQADLAAADRRAKGGLLSYLTV